MIDWTSWLGLAIAVIIALAAAGLLVGATAVVARRAARRHDWAKALVSRARHSYRLFVVVIALWIAVAFTLPEPSWRRNVNHLALIVAILAGTWLVSALVSFALGRALIRYRVDIPDNRVARRTQTQILIVRRLAVVIIVLVGLASVLLTFPGVQAIGASVLASAGVVSIIGGLAAQSTLGNVFAGLQLAFSDAIRVDDVVIVQGEWGRIEEITLTYVVVHIWDDRRMVVPSTFFTTTPFENWTRSSSQLLGAIEMDLDWQVNPGAMREELEDAVKRTANWDGRAAVLQVTDALAGYVHVRILVSAADAPTLFDLRCFVREAMVAWVQQHSPATMPRTRIQLGEDETAPITRLAESTPDKSGLFTGTADAVQRATQFTSPIPVAEKARTEAENPDASENPDAES